MKIGILTFHRAENVGAALQVWALQQFLVKLGHNVLVIDYRCEEIEMTYDILYPRLLWKKKNFFSALRLYIERIRTYKTRTIKKELFSNFREKNLYLSKPVTRLKDIPECDLYITGSDQVWNLNLIKGYNKFYFLDFPAKHRISYAASLERNSYERFWKARRSISSILQKYDGISVRESWISDKISTIVPSMKVEVCVDPVFLIGISEYLELVKKPDKSNYIFVYQVIESSLVDSIANRLSRKYGLPIIRMQAQQKSKMSKRGDVLGFGPQEFLGYINNAKYVVTTSFHGLAFSLIFRKDFWVINTNSSNRQKNILELCGISNRLISSEEKMTFDPINYELVEQNLHSVIERSKNFICKHT